MPKLSFKATEMKDAKVVHISLVDRAATRMPFKVIKQENPMTRLADIDLSRVFKTDKKPEAPTIAAVITMKSEGFDSVKTQLEAAGFSIVKAEEHEDGSVAFVQSETMPKDATLVRVSDHAVLAVKSFRPYMVDLSIDGTPFSDVVASQGFYPGVGTMCDVLRNGVLSLAEKSVSPDEASIAVAKMFDEARDYAVSMVRALPSVAFKLEGIKPVVAAKSEDAPKEDTHADGQQAPSGESGDKPAAEESVEKKDMPAKADCQSCGAKDQIVGEKCSECGTVVAAPSAAKKSEEVVPTGVTSAEVSAMIGTQLADLATKMEQMISGVTKGISDLSGSVSALTARVDEAEVVAKSAKEAINGTVVMGSSSDDRQVAGVKKSEYRSREIDTGFAPRNRR